jgi:hypothetical protein
MVIRPGVIREIKYGSGNYVSTQTFCLKRREQEENATFGRTGHYMF